MSRRRSARLVYLIVPVLVLGAGGSGHPALSEPMSFKSVSTGGKSLLLVDGRRRRNNGRNTRCFQEIPKFRKISTLLTPLTKPFPYDGIGRIVGASVGAYVVAGLQASHNAPARLVK
jgi:hypothetical protein